MSIEKWINSKRLNALRNITEGMRFDLPGIPPGIPGILNVPGILPEFPGIPTMSCPGSFPWFNPPLASEEHEIRKWWGCGDDGVVSSLAARHLTGLR